MTWSSRLSRRTSTPDLAALEERTMLNRGDVRSLVAGAVIVVPVLVGGAWPVWAGDNETGVAPRHPTKAQIEHDERATLHLRRDVAGRPEPARPGRGVQVPGDGVAAWQLALSGVAGAAVTGLVVAARRRGPLGHDVTVAS